MTTDARFQAHPFKAQGVGNLCAVSDCGQPWSDEIHEPARWQSSMMVEGYGESTPAQIKLEFLSPDSFRSMVHGAINREAQDFAAQAQDATDAEHERMEGVLGDWWIALAQEEVDKVVPKAIEYGALDLIQIGQDLALTAGRQVTDEEAAEMGIYFYLRGKLARWTDAILRGDRPSDDTLHDLGVYVRMAQRVRHSGGWPGLN